MFCEQFEAGMYLLRLFGVLNGSEGVESCRSKARSSSTREERHEANEKAAEVFADKKYKIWCELIQCLDKKSLLFVRSQKCDGPASGKALCDRFKSFERPRLQQLIEKLTSFRKDQYETIVDYITTAEDNLSQVNEALSEQMLISILLKGLPKDCETFCALVNFTKETKSLNEVKRDLKTFDTDRRKPRAEETTFLSRNEVEGHLCGGPGLKFFEFTQKERTETKQTKSFEQPRVCFESSKHGHIVKDCRSQVTNRDSSHSNHRMQERFCTHCKKEGHTLSTCFKLKRNQSNRVTDEARLAVQQDDSGESEEVQFSFFANEDTAVSNKDILVDSGCTNKKIIDRKLFTELNEKRKGVFGYANKTESKLCKRGCAVFCVRIAKKVTRKEWICRMLFTCRRTTET